MLPFNALNWITYTALKDIAMGTDDQPSQKNPQVQAGTPDAPRDTSELIRLAETLIAAGDALTGMVKNVVPGAEIKQDKK